MHRLITQGPDLVLRALDDFHQLVRVLQRMEDVGRISKDIRDLEKRLASTEAVLRDIAKPARTTDTIMRAMPGSKVVSARAKAQKERARSQSDRAREAKASKPKPRD